ncbi:MAG: phosphoribosylformylglycinamidine synthase subunit PurL [Candidatus Dormibacteria bacterium]
MGATAEKLLEVALSSEEYELAERLLGRPPGDVELGIIGALWSEHCGYKTSRPLLSRLPRTGPQVLIGPGENAGAVDIGNGLAVVFKIESHNHPSAIEPYQGAATGVGGILRDVFTMGARPVALLNSLRFGPLEEAEQQRLFDGVVAGIGGYGNCIGVPTVGGEVYFDESYRHNCLVNAMCVGVIEQRRRVRAIAAGPGNPVLLVGADTGRDGIHGATFASAELDERSESRRPAVQVGNPFLEKCLMEACLELAGDPRVVAMQDLGAAGLTSSAAELAHKGGCGIDIDVAAVTRREHGMSAYEVMLSESQERMLIVVRAGEEEAVAAAFARWDLHSDSIGTITDSSRFVIRDGTEQVCDLPLPLLIDQVPTRSPASGRPAGHAALLSHDPLADAAPWDMGDALVRLLGSPNIGNRRPVYRRYDHQVGVDTVAGPGGDAAVVRVRGGAGALAFSVDGNARHVALDPRRGAAIAVCEAARNVVAVGARPLAVTNCLNFGNPDKPEVFWQLERAIEGIADACSALDIPVVSGNVSLYNDNQGRSIDPTPVIGMVGHLGDLGRLRGMAFRSPGDSVALVGPLGGSLGAELGGSEYQRLAHGINAGPRPELDLGLERRVQALVLDAITAGALQSAHDCGDGGLAVALAECGLQGGLGATITVVELTGASEGARRAAILFGESQSRFLVSFAREATMQLRELVEHHRVPFRELGVVGGEDIVIEGALRMPLHRARHAYDTALEVAAHAAAGGSV